MQAIYSYIQTECKINQEYFFAFTLCNTHRHRKIIIIIIIINPFTAGVTGAPQMILQPVFPIFPCFPLPSGTCQTPGLSIPWYFFPPVPLPALPSPPFHCALQDSFAQTWWMGHTTIPLQFASLYDCQEVSVWSNCLLDLGTDFLVGNMVFVWDV